MNNTFYTDLNPELITELDSYINSNKPSIISPALSNYQLTTVSENLKIIKQKNQPGYIYAGDYAGGYHHLNYYRHSNGNIYIINFYLQEFDCYYTLDLWSKINIRDN